VRAAAEVIARRPPIAEWTVFFGGVSSFEAAICGVATGLVLGMAPADPGGKWWGKEASPPPPPRER